MSLDSIVMAEIWEKYREVYHYTSRKGLKGILESQVLFATRFDHLNDSTELSILRERLPQLLEPVVRQYLLEQCRLSARTRRNIKALGGIPHQTKIISADFSQIHFDAAFASTDSKPATTTPYIISFCGFKDSEKYERENGLLSQWRAYGNGGGFALEFDTEKVWKLCLKEQANYDYGPITFDDVVYDDDEEHFSTEIGPAIEDIIADVDSYLRGKPGQIPDAKKIGQILSSFVRVKHCAFKEEHEVRIMAAPITAEIRSLMSTEEAARHPLPVKEPFRSLESNEDKWQIRLFDTEGDRLPIKRIIVGPQPDQNSAIQMVEKLIGGTPIKISASKTPLVRQA